jgi:D-alanyl-D-alanine carboxypeptidase
VSTAEDLVKMVKARDYALIREFTTTTAHEIETDSGRNILPQFQRAGAELGRKSGFQTGFINEADAAWLCKPRLPPGRW